MMTSTHALLCSPEHRTAGVVRYHTWYRGKYARCSLGTPHVRACPGDGCLVGADVRDARLLPPRSPRSARASPPVCDLSV